jgi:hypothetical protein
MIIFIPSFPSLQKQQDVLIVVNINFNLLTILTHALNYFLPLLSINLLKNKNMKLQMLWLIEQYE